MNKQRLALISLAAMAATPGLVVHPQVIAGQVSTAPAPPITPERIGEINAWTRRHGVAHDMGAGISARMGLTQPGVRYRACQLVFFLPDSADRRHYWSIHEAPRDIIHVFWIQGQSADAWVFDLRGDLITAGTMRDGRFEVVPVEQARTTFEAEMRLWSQLPLASPNVPPAQRCNAVAGN